MRTVDTMLDLILSTARDDERIRAVVLNGSRANPNARTMAERYVRPELMRLVDWYLALRGGFALNPGKYGKRYAELLPPDLWALYARTYADLDLAQGWAALHATLGLVTRLAPVLAEALGFPDPRAEAEAVAAYLKRLQRAGVAG